MKNICVYCGSSVGKTLAYRQAAQNLASELVARELGLVFGGASVGLMGVLANEVLALGGRTVGVIPKHLALKEVAHEGLDELIVVDSMHERKATMAELADGFIALPGGWGTLEEIFEIMTWAQLGLHEKPCGLLNVEGYYDHLGAFLQHAREQEFVREAYASIVMIENDAGVLLDRFGNYEAPRVKKWLTTAEQA